MGNPIKVISLIVGLSFLGFVSLPGIAGATEGGQSVYVPGAYGNFRDGIRSGAGFLLQQLCVLVQRHRNEQALDQRASPTQR